MTRATPVEQTLTVNRRPVADPVLQTGVRVAYRDVIASGRHAIVALYLDLPPDELDVNVHPAKTELRFRDAAAVRSLVIGSCGAPWRSGPGVRCRRRGPAVHLVHSRASSYPAPYRSVPLPGMAETPARFRCRRRRRPPHAAERRRSARRLSLGAPVAQVLDTYVIAVAADGSLVLVDQHAAHERLTHEALREQMLDGGVRVAAAAAAIGGRSSGQRRRAAGRPRGGDLARLGLELEEFGAGAILVRALPAALGSTEAGPLLRDLADELAEPTRPWLSARLDAVIARMACHGSIRAGRQLGQAEMSALLRQMEATPRAATCSHGRPTVLKLSKADIEKMFGRR